jgi:hypothetical protein
MLMEIRGHLCICMQDCGKQIKHPDLGPHGYMLRPPVGAVVDAFGILPSLRPASGEMKIGCLVS